MLAVALGTASATTQSQYGYGGYGGYGYGYGHEAGGQLSVCHALLVRSNKIDRTHRLSRLTVSVTKHQKLLQYTNYRRCNAEIPKAARP